MNAQAGAGSAAAEPGTPGDMLRAQRERRGFSVQQAAEDLHLDVWLIEALETNQFLALGAPVYAKGHLRKYAMLLGLPPALVIERYEALSGTPNEPTPVPATVTSPMPRERRRTSKWLWWVLAAVAAAAIAWVVFQWVSSRDFAIFSSTGAEAPVIDADGSVRSDNSMKTAERGASE
jgi:cytoskeleton protein RodZ